MGLACRIEPALEFFQNFSSINNCMEKEKKTSGHGGARPGAGRKKGGTNGLTIESLLTAVQNKANGQAYEELLAEDFVHARDNDRHLAQKYHNLILSKVAATLTKVENIDSEDEVTNKAEAFAEALLALTQTATNKATKTPTGKRS